MTKAELAQMLQQHNGALSRAQATATIDKLLAVMKQRLVQGERILITNFGSFEVIARRKRRGRNPVTGEIISILPRRTLVFRMARRLEDELNGGETS